MFVQSVGCSHSHLALELHPHDFPMSALQLPQHLQDTLPMHPKATRKMLKGKPVKITWKIRVREDHDAEKYGEPIREWEWRFVPAKNAPLTKKRKEAQQREKMAVLELSDDSDSDDAGF